MLKDKSCCPKLVKELEYWLEFSIDNGKDWADLGTLKDNFIETEHGFAYELDDHEMTVRHPCGGVTGEYVYAFEM